MSDISIVPRALWRDPLRATYSQVPADGAEYVVKQVPLRGDMVPYLESLAEDGEGGSGGSLEFIAYISGAPVGRWWGKTRQTLGAIGAPMPIGDMLPAGGVLELRVKNTGAVPYDAYTDGAVAYYERELP